ncbi:hypothetical protein AVEN_227059-1 [Araneus ventricosus]|uniref:Uncharacterized protein n=1 Tax=Araneus ventricosus TaxID=182803 RepID=A0A4Y2LBZ4_ARAVE|nr:hypothetical protein AVEN_227059-1 [Araneus ventricosus]
MAGGSSTLPQINNQARKSTHCAQCTRERIISMLLYLSLPLLLAFSRDETNTTPAFSTSSGRGFLSSGMDPRFPQPCQNHHRFAHQVEDSYHEGRDSRIPQSCQNHHRWAHRCNSLGRGFLSSGMGFPDPAIMSKSSLQLIRSRILIIRDGIPLSRNHAKIIIAWLIVATHQVEDSFHQ